LRDVLYTQCLYGVCKWDGYSKFARVVCGEHVIFMHENVMEMCGEKLANRQCRGHVWGQRGRREVLGDGCVYGGKQR